MHVSSSTAMFWIFRVNNVRNGWTMPGILALARKEGMGDSQGNHSLHKQKARNTISREFHTLYVSCIFQHIRPAVGDTVSGCIRPACIFFFSFCGFQHNSCPRRFSRWLSATKVFAQYVPTATWLRENIENNLRIFSKYSFFEYSFNCCFFLG